MVTIAAQANPSSLGDDTFAISNLSRGLIDRINSEKSTSSFNIEKNNIKPKNDLKTLKLHLEGILGKNDKFYINVSSIEPSYNTYKELIANYKTTEEKEDKGNVIIPLEFSLELDGLSGIIPNSAFVVPTNILPSSYKTSSGLPKIAFIIHSINQDFSNNKWTTKLSGQALNIRFDNEEYQISKIYKQPIINNNIINEEPILIPEKNPKVVDSIPSLSRLKNIIGFWESNNNYNIANTGRNGLKSIISVSTLTFSQLQTQQNILDQNNRQRVFAAGRFQIIPSTMNIIKNRLNLKNNDYFSPITQEKIMDYILLYYRKNVGDYIKGLNQGTKNDLEKAINNIGYEWASMPVITKNNGEVVGNLDIGTGNIANYGGKGSNPTYSKTNIKTMANLLIEARISYSGKSPIFIPNYYNPFL
jgi:muramidase (phage lysozyme)